MLDILRVTTPGPDQGLRHLEGNALLSPEIANLSSLDVLFHTRTLSPTSKLGRYRASLFSLLERYALYC